MSRTRIVVAGGGPVGLAFACAARGAQVRVLEASPARAAPAESFDLRVFAVSAGTREFLREIEAWHRIDPKRVAPVRRMEIFGDEGARLSFSSRPAGALAWIVEAGRLAAAIEAHAASLANVEISRGASVVDLAAGAGKVHVDLQGGERVGGDLLVGADGPDSLVRKHLAMPFQEEPYGEAAIVANFATAKPHGAIARQWFRSDGVLAWLPLPGERISIVWSTPLAHADTLAALDPRELERRVRDAGGGALGELRLVSPVARFPLRSVRVPDPVAPGVALVGDAAHAVHPLAGQGVNLGFQDARLLAEILAARTAVERPGDARVLRRYVRERREDVTAMHFVTDGLDKLFGSGERGARAFRNLGLRLADSQGWAKAALVRRAMR